MADFILEGKMSVDNDWFTMVVSNVLTQASCSHAVYFPQLISYAYFIFLMPG